MKKNGLVVVAVVAAISGAVFSAYWRQPDVAAATAKGAVTIDALELRATDGTGVRLSDLVADKERVLVNFWATWCPPCLHEMPLLEKTAAVLPQVKVVGVSFEEKDVVVEFLKKRAVNYDILTSNGDVFDFMRQNGNITGGLPYTILLDNEGNTIRQKIGDFKTAEEIENFAALAE